jgi:phosphopantothenoylcysteine decarboxylase/phosphopantothenate--cysteine ligase
VADWRAETVAPGKLKKTRRRPAPLRLVENPDILATLAAPGPRRPKLVVGFAAETEALEANARAKLKRKRCDWLLANDVSKAEVFGGDANAVSLVTRKAVTPWPERTKQAVAERLATEIAKALA